jgi:1-deoxy-D-xylulose-5-phosphate reductoisomerase
VLDEAPDFDEPGTVEEVLAAEAWARAHARSLVTAVMEGS